MIWTKPSVTHHVSSESNLLRAVNQQRLGKGVTVFGVNRIRRKAALLRRNLDRYRAQATQPECRTEELQRHLPDRTGHLEMLARVVGGMVDRPLLSGNRIDPLVNGDEAYPAMLEAIQQARRTISLVTYIFVRDEVGMAFAHALGEAARRGMEVRVLIDAMGTWYSCPPFSMRCTGRG